MISCGLELSESGNTNAHSCLLLVFVRARARQKALFNGRMVDVMVQLQTPAQKNLFHRVNKRTKSNDSFSIFIVSRICPFRGVSIL